jgi:hypothetical protein
MTSLKLFYVGTNGALDTFTLNFIKRLTQPITFIKNLINGYDTILDLYVYTYHYM